MIFGLLIGALIGAVILRAAIAIYQLLSGGSQSPHAVPEPSFGKSMGIMLIVALAQFAANFIIGMALGAGAQATGGPAPGMGLAAAGGSFVISLLLMSLLLTAMLPTTLPRAFLVTLLYLVVCILVGIVLFGVLMLVGVSMFR
ncbi:MAG: hypothetical protein U0744_04330 [Gemmataceae bacterium]